MALASARVSEAMTSLRGRHVADRTGVNNSSSYGVKMEVDIHGYHPEDINVAAIVQQAWEMGETELWIIHGHGRNRGRRTPEIYYLCPRPVQSPVAVGIESDGVRLNSR